MGSHELCASCVREGRKECWFKTTIRARIKALPPSENQTPIAKGTTVTKDAFEAHKANARNRIQARYYGCPHVNYNPQSPKLQPNL